MHAEDRQLLEAQLATAIFRSRKNTGAGFYTDFDVNQKGIAAITGERLRAGPQVKVTELNHGMGFILWLRMAMPTASKATRMTTAPSGLTWGKSPSS
jgi:hypothetical protein